MLYFISFSYISDENGATCDVHMHVLCLPQLSFLSSRVNSENYVASIEDHGSL
jgi:hypothetical protein